MSFPIRIDQTSSIPLHRQLYDRFRTAILDGVLTPGVRVPSTRQLARQLGVARTTVMTAYEQLVADGYLEGHPGAWTSVAHDLPGDLPITLERPQSYNSDVTTQINRRTADVTAQYKTFALDQSVVYNFRRPFAPAVDIFPLKEWRRLLFEHWGKVTQASLVTVDPTGVPELRHELTSYVRMTRGINCDPEQIIITTGNEQAIDVLAKMILIQGDRVAIEDPSNHRVQYLFRSHDAELLPITVDRDGLVVNELPALGGRTPRLVHVTPTHQYPTGVTLSLRRRLELLQWAQANPVLVIEDDSASEYSYEGATLEALQALDSAGVVAYIGTFTKVLGPSIQIGYLVVPPPLVAAARAVHRLIARPADVAHQHVLAMFMQRGGLSRYLHRLRRVHVARRDALVQALHEVFADDVVIGPATAGLQVQVRWPNHPITPELLDRLEAAGVGVVPVQQLYLRPSSVDGGVVMAFASLEEARIRTGVAALGAVLRGDRSASP